MIFAIPIALFIVIFLLYRNRHRLINKFSATENKKESPDVGDAESSMSIGMTLGMCFGLVFGQSMFGDTGTGMVLGMCLGMCIGIAIGAAMDENIKNKKSKESGESE